MKQTLYIVSAALILAACSNKPGNIQSNCRSITSVEKMGYKGRVKTISIKFSGAKYENGKWVHDDAFVIFTTIYQFGKDGNVTSRKDMTDSKTGHYETISNFTFRPNNMRIYHTQDNNTLIEADTLIWKSDSTYTDKYYKVSEAGKHYLAEEYNYLIHMSDCMPKNIEHIQYDSTGSIAKKKTFDPVLTEEDKMLMQRHGNSYIFYNDKRSNVLATDKYDNPLSILTKSEENHFLKTYTYEYYQ